MKELMLAGDLYPNAVSGDKFLTIRKGLRDFEPGDTIQIINADNKDESIERTVISVSKYLKSIMVPFEIVATDGFLGYTDMIESMKRFYPDFSKDTPVTVIRWAIKREQE